MAKINVFLRTPMHSFEQSAFNAIQVLFLVSGSSTLVFMSLISIHSISNDTNKIHKHLSLFYTAEAGGSCQQSSDPLQICIRNNFHGSEALKLLFHHFLQIYRIFN